MDLIKQSISGSFLYVTKYYLLCRGFTVETCIVVQHVGGGSTNSPQTSPVAKKPCPPIQVILDSITFCFQILLQKKCKKKNQYKIKIKCMHKGTLSSISQFEQSLSFGRNINLNSHLILCACP